MAKENNIKEELLKQTDTNFSTSSAEIQKLIIMKNTARVRRLEWITIAFWILVVICFMIGACIEYDIRSVENNTWYLDTFCSLLGIILRALFLIAIFLTVSLFIRSRSLTLQQIQNRLANIEEQLKRMSQDG